MSAIEAGFMVFLAEGNEGIGAVRATGAQSFTLYIENAGEFQVPLSAVRKVHDGKVLLDPKSLPQDVLTATKHVHDAEDPKLVG